MQRRDLVQKAVAAIELGPEEYERRLAAMPNRELAVELGSLIGQLCFLRLLFLMAQEQGFEDVLLTYLREGSADERQAA